MDTVLVYTPRWPFLLALSRCLCWPLLKPISFFLEFLPISHLFIPTFFLEIGITQGIITLSFWHPYISLWSNEYIRHRSLDIIWLFMHPLNPTRILSFIRNFHWYDPSRVHVHNCTYLTLCGSVPLPIIIFLYIFFLSEYMDIPQTWSRQSIWAICLLHYCTANVL